MKKEKYMKLKAKIFREYDIRGIAGKDLNEAIVEQLGKAIAGGAQVRRVRRPSDPPAAPSTRCVNDFESWRR